MSTEAAVETRTITYDDAVVRQFLIASVAWGLIGMLVGLVAALQLSFPAINFETSWLTFGRIRPLHTNASIFALVGNMIFAGVYYSTQRLCKTRMASDLLSSINMWGWQLIILCAAITLPLGITQAKEYAELEWWIDIMVAVVWVVFASQLLLDAGDPEREEPLRRSVVLHRDDRGDRDPLHRQQPLAAGQRDEELPVLRRCAGRDSSSGGTATTRWRSS
jgi:cbb3-type cytochrome oxidase subunit 1